MNFGEKLKRIVGARGWEERLFREIAGPSHEEAPDYHLTALNSAMIDQLTIWTPEDKGENPFAEKVDPDGLVVLTDPPDWFSSVAGQEKAEAAKRERAAQIDRMTSAVLSAESFPAIEPGPLPAVAEAETPKQVPDYTECLTGWRRWRVDGGYLFADSTTRLWRPRVASPAGCASDINGCGNSPNEFCGCGYYSYRDVASLAELFEGWKNPEASLAMLDDYAFGPVYVWGKVIVHEFGYRSQYAYPKEIWSFNPKHVGLGTTYNVRVRILKV
jgi:hypothetical protein